MVLCVIKHFLSFSNRCFSCLSFFDHVKDIYFGNILEAMRFGSEF